MSFRRAGTVTGTSIFLFASAALVAIGCGGGGTTKTGTGGATGGGGQGSGGHGSGGNGGHGTGGMGTGGMGTGGMGTGGMGTGGEGTGGAGPMFPNCVPIAADTALILDFTTVPNPAQAQFNFGTNFGGGTYEYPGGIITSTFTGMNWHMTGTVSTYSGFGLYLQCKSDVSAFTGIQFDIGGTFAGSDGGTSPAHVTMGIGTPVDEFDSAHAGQLTWGTCTAGCASPTRDVLIPATPATVMAPWTSFGGGTPVGSLDPTQILSIPFSFPWSGTMTRYDIDITIDNIMFMGGPRPDGGTPDAPTDVAMADTGIPDTAPADVATTDTGTPDTALVVDAAGN